MIFIGSILYKYCLDIPEYNIKSKAVKVTFTFANFWIYITRKKEKKKEKKGGRCYIFCWLHKWRNLKIHWILELDLFCAQQVKWQKSLWPKTGEMTVMVLSTSKPEKTAWYPTPGHKRTTGQSDSPSHFPLLLWTNYVRFYFLLTCFKRELFKFNLIF